VLAIFVISIGHKMIGFELAITCQIVYFSYALHEQPSYLFGAVKAFKLVTGYHTMFYNDQYRDIASKLTGELQISKQLMENVLIWVCVVVFIVIGALALLIFYRRK
jgi:hypothetical protein